MRNKTDPSIEGYPYEILQKPQEMIDELQLQSPAMQGLGASLEQGVLTMMEMGMDETHFGPNLTVTRAQAVTFLWRSQGCPEPTSLNNPFVDVPSTEYYYKPVLWAVENNITKGTTDTTFDPEDTLTTAHIVTFLYRTKNPGMDGWNGEAAAWAADSNGKPFGVDIAVNNATPCPRCNVVQFLYKLSK